MTTNRLIVLLDVRRGFHPEGHTGTLELDLKVLVDDGLIYCDQHHSLGKTVNTYYHLTKEGEALVDRLLQQADLR